MPPTVTIALPVFNEIESLETVVRAALDVIGACALPEGGEVLIVDDGSTDGSCELATRLASEHDAVRAVHHTDNLGYSRVQRACYREALGTWVLLLPADGQVAPDVLGPLMAAGGGADGEAGLVVGLPGDGGEPPRLSSRAYHTAVALLFGRRPWWRLGPCLLVRRELVERLPLRSTTPVCMTELAVRAEHAGAIVRGCTIPVRRRRAGQSSRRRLYAQSLRVLGELLALRSATLRPSERTTRPAGRPAPEVLTPSGRVRS